MLKTILSIFIFSLPAMCQNEISTATVAKALESDKLFIVYPYEGMSLSSSIQKTFVFGSINPSTASLYINGEKVLPHSNGGFIAYVPVMGDSFNASLFDGYSTHTYIRKVNLPSEKKETEKNDIYINLISPNKNMEIMPDESIIFYAKATPAQDLKCYISNGDKISFKENPAKSGSYYSVYRVKRSDEGKTLSFKLKFKKGIFSSNFHLNPVVSVKVLESSYLVKTSTDYVVLKNEISGGYTMFLPKDVTLEVTGKVGSSYRVKAGNLVLWLDESKASFYSSMPRKNTETGNLVFSSSGNIVSAKFAIYDKVPYMAFAQGGKFNLDLFNTSLHTNWVIYDSSDTRTKNVTFSQEGEGHSSFTFNFREDIWGYSMEYSTNSLIINFKFKPAYEGKYPNPLKGIKIVLDPGHSPKRIPPFDGAVGPSGYFEFEANKAIADKLALKLQKLGASVYMTRIGDENVPLTDRPLIAKKFDADIFISIHNNAIPDGEDPFSKPRGFQVYYHHPNSMPLAKSIHKAFLKNVPLPDEGLRYGDYHVIRQTYMPAILIENAYMILPQQEEMLKSEKGIETFSSAITSGILDFFNIHKD